MSSNKDAAQPKINKEKGLLRSKNTVLMCLKLTDWQFKSYIHIFICNSCNHKPKICNTKEKGIQVSWWSSGWESALQCRGNCFPSLVWDDPTYHAATKPMHHNCWICALEPRSRNYWSPTCLRACAPREATTMRSLCTAARESPHAAVRNQYSQKEMVLKC